MLLSLNTSQSISNYNFIPVIGGITIIGEHGPLENSNKYYFLLILLGSIPFVQINFYEFIIFCRVKIKNNIYIYKYII